jgi:hypothetical protein
MKSYAITRKDRLTKETFLCYAGRDGETLRDTLLSTDLEYTQMQLKQLKKQYGDKYQYKLIQTFS